MELLGDTTPECTIAISTADPAALWITARAALKLGRPLLPLDPALQEETVTPLLRLAGAQSLVSERQLGDLHHVAPSRLRDLPPSDSPHFETAAADNEIALYIATSGSTGTPRLVMLSRRNLCASADASQARASLGPGDRWLACLPLFHIGGYSILWRCARFGAEAVLHSRFDAKALLDSLEESCITHLSLVPAMLARLLDLSSESPPPGLQHLLVGGAALDERLAERAVRAGWPIQPTWGMSETASQVATGAPLELPWQAGRVGPARRRTGATH